MERNHTSLSVPTIDPDSHYPNHVIGNFVAEPHRSDAVRALVKIHNRLSNQINQMSSVLTDAACRDCLRCIFLYCTNRLKEISEFIHQGHIFPWFRLRLWDKDPEVPNEIKPLRVGIYPIAANPIHWGHLATGLSATAQLRLDKVIYIIAGSDPRKPDLVSQEIRHAVGKNLIEMFSPLFSYSPLARGNTLEGEINLFRFLKLNRYQAMEVFYLAGTDHFHRVNPLTGRPDTIWKLEESMRSQSGAVRQRNQTVSVAFLEREPPKKRLDSFLPIHLLPPLPFTTSSTSIRSALADPSNCEGISCLPYDAFVYFNMYKFFNTEWPVSTCEDARSRACPISKPWLIA
jgi:nicotinic acid mononucleotide adenylyltransferase